MTKNAIISNLYTGKNFNECISKMKPDHLQDDLKAEVITIVCEWPEEKIVALHQRKELEFFVARVILNQMRSTSSAFAKKYRAPIIELNQKEVAAEEYDIAERETREAIEDVAMEEIDKLYWYNAEIIRLYMKLGNYRALEKDTRIPWESCYRTVKGSLKILKEKANAARPLFTKEERAFIQNRKS